MALETIGVGRFSFMIPAFNSFISLPSAAYPPMSQLTSEVIRQGIF
jgi:hypothetical protein